MKGNGKTNRRNVLTTIGAGIMGGTVLTGSVNARGNHYGNGNALGQFLNEAAVFKESPVWDTGIADRTGQDEVGVEWGGPTEVINPVTGETFQGPWSVKPRAVKVSPDTDVIWTWVDWEDAIDAHHLVSYFDPPYEDEFPNPFLGEPHEHPGGEDEFFVHEDIGESFTYTFDETGTYLYFCIPHGTPYEIYHPLLDAEVENLFGQRGAVIVSDE